MTHIENDRKQFANRKKYIHAILNDLDTGMIKDVVDANKESVFYMLCFCLLVSQSKHILVEEAIETLRHKDFLNNNMSIG